MRRVWRRARRLIHACDLQINALELIMLNNPHEDIITVYTACFIVWQS